MFNFNTVMRTLIVAVCLCSNKLLAVSQFGCTTSTFELICSSFYFITVIKTKSWGTVVRVWNKFEFWSFLTNLSMGFMHNFFLLFGLKSMKEQFIYFIAYQRTSRFWIVHEMTLFHVSNHSKYFSFSSCFKLILDMNLGCPLSLFLFSLCMAQIK